MMDENLPLLPDSPLQITEGNRATWMTDDFRKMFLGMCVYEQKNS
jgi:hypothetical protein